MLKKPQFNSKSCSFFLLSLTKVSAPSVLGRCEARGSLSLVASSKCLYKNPKLNLFFPRVDTETQDPKFTGEFTVVEAQKLHLYSSLLKLTTTARGRRGAARAGQYRK